MCIRDRRAEKELQEQRAIEAEEARQAELANQLAELKVEQEQLSRAARDRKIQQVRRMGEGRYQRVRRPLVKAAFGHVQRMLLATQEALVVHAGGREQRTLTANLARWRVAVEEGVQRRAEEERVRAAVRHEELGTKADRLHRTQLLMYGVLLWSLRTREGRVDRSEAESQRARRAKMEAVLVATAARSEPGQREPGSPAVPKQRKAPSDENNKTEKRAHKVKVRVPAVSPWPEAGKTRNSSASRDPPSLGAQPKQVRVQCSAVRPTSNPYDFKPSKASKRAQVPREPAFQRQMHSRATDRAEKRKALQDKYALKQRELEEAAELEEQEREREKQQQQQQQAQQRRLEKLSQEQHEREKLHQKQLLVHKTRLADLHRVQQSARLGWRKWLIHCTATEVLQIAADKHCRRSLLARHFSALKDFSDLAAAQKQTRLLRALSRVLLRAALAEWTAETENTLAAVAGQCRRRALRIGRLAFKAWFEIVAMRLASQAAEMRRIGAIAEKYLVVWKTRGLVRSWVEAKNRAKAEKESEERRDQMRSKVDGWLGDFRQKRNSAARKFG
eukprot:TRINITY_DN11175_c0_g2_i2.p1 TRINITY_DN11175_c0_g2~~TRINITY_DN11175_c0_g2_i2.p1  ORF type:complete len:561 (+),score=144.30 TRINITY_DN11175_c0_g2_i2:190-1872(+)